MSDLHAGPLPEASPEGEHRPGPLKRADHIGRTIAWGRDWWQRRREQREAARLAAAAGHVQAGPLQHGTLHDDTDAAHRPVAAPKPQRYRKSWREKRWERRRKRRFTEEVLGWVLVPVILLSGFWAVKAGLNAMGTNFTALIQGIRTALSAAGKA